MLLIHYKIYNSTNDLPEAWDTLPTGDIFLKSTFLRGLETSLPSNINPYYLCIYNQEKLAGIAIIQRVQMYTEDIFRKKSTNLVKQLAKKIVAKIVKGNALIIGNLMHTGQHGLYLQKDVLSEKDYIESIAKAIKELSKQIKREFNKNVRIVAFKDYFETDSIHQNIAFFKKENLYKVQVQPNMVFTISEDWKTPEDYIASFNKKYRRRYRTARKKKGEIICTELSKEAIEKESNKLFKLYESVSNKAQVNSFKLAENHFLELKVALQDNFKIFGYYLDDKLIGFYSLIINEEILETYFLGYNHELQHQHQMYLNMLFDMACYGIDNNFKQIVYARTAMEIKSSIGAKPYTMHIYLKHTNHIIANTVLRLIVKYMNPIRAWEERHPFK